MAGMFYTLQEVIEKLGKTEAEIKAFVKEGKLREFRDGAKQLYKIEDVDALAGSLKGGTAKLDDSLQIALDETAEISLAPEELDVLMGNDSKDNLQESKFKLDETGELMGEDSLDNTKGKSDGKIADDEILLEPAEGTNAASDSISLSAESSQQGQDVSNGDTKISLGGDTINVLNGSDTEFKITDDTSSETKLVESKPKALDEKSGTDGLSVARLDDDVNLDAGGSGSGLLDLSLQADDTSLGAVLDDIYPESPAAPPTLEPLPGAGSSVADEAEKILEQTGPAGISMPEQIAAPQTASYAAAMAIEPPPDTASNIYGVILFVPLIVIIFTAIVIASSYKSIFDLQILSTVEPIIWYVVGGIGAVVILMALIASFSGGTGGPKPPKAPKVKKAKPPKEKKAKKGK